MQLKTFNLALDSEGRLDDGAMRAELEGCVVHQVWEHFLPAERVWLVMVSDRPAPKRERLAAMRASETKLARE